MWKTMKNIYKRSSVLIQEAFVFDNSLLLQRPSIFLFTINDCLNYINYEIEIYQNSYGSTGICLKFIEKWLILYII